MAVEKEGRMGKKCIVHVMTVGGGRELNAETVLDFICEWSKQKHKSTLFEKKVFSSS